MNTRTIPVMDNHTQNLVLGRTGEFCIEKVIFDLTPYINVYGEGSADVVWIAPGTTTEAPVVIERNGDTVEWLITASVMAKEGIGTARVYYYPKSNGRKISGDLKCIIVDGATIGEEPDLIADWIHHAEETKDSYITEGRRIVSDAKAEADRASEDSEKAKSEAEKALESADSAKASADRTEESGQYWFSTINTAGAENAKNIKDLGDSYTGQIESSGTQMLADLSKATSDGVSTVKSEAESEAGKVVGSVTSEGTKQIGLINQAKSEAVAAVSAEKTAGVNAVRNETTAGIEAVNQAKADIQAKAEEQLARIPEVTRLAEETSQLSELTQHISDELGILVFNWEQGGMYQDGHADYPSTKRIRTNRVELPANKTIRIGSTIPSDKNLQIARYAEDGSYLYGVMLDAKANQTVTFRDDVAMIRLQYGYSGGTFDVNPIVGSEEVVIYVDGLISEVKNNHDEALKEIIDINEKILDIDRAIDTLENDICGVYDIPFEWRVGVGCSYAARGYYNDANRSCTKIIPIPKDGMYVYVDNGVQFRLDFYVEREERYESADAYPYSFPELGSTRDTMQNVCAFYPYMEGVLFSITTSNANIGRVHASTGKVKKSGGRMPFIVPCVAVSDYNNQKFEVLKHYYEGGTFYSYMRNYCTILPLKYAKRIIAAPPYSLCAEIHRINHDDMNSEIVATEYSHIPYTTSNYGSATCGKSYIDLSKYNFDGYAVIVICPHFKPIKTATNGKFIEYGYFGMTTMYNEIMDSVFVQWRSGVSVNYESGINPIAKSNIETLMSIKIPNLMKSQAGKGYGSWINRFLVSWGEIGVGSPFWYAGGNLWNVPLMHVNPKSFITASKNHNSRIYDCRPTFGNTTEFGNLYGSVCSVTSSLVSGKPMGRETHAFVTRMYDDCDYREYDGINSIKAGDYIAYGDFTDEEGHTNTNKDFGHIVYVTEVVTIDGNVFCVNVFENANPYMRIKPFVNYEAYKGYKGYDMSGYPNERSIFHMHPIEEIAKRSNKIIARLHNDSYTSIRQAYGKYDFVDYPVTEVMCDRGSDSVYCIGERCVLTVTDKNIASFDLYVNGVKEKNVNLSEASNTIVDDDGNRVFEFLDGFVTKTGNAEIKVNGVAKETFYVPPVRHIEYHKPTLQESIPDKIRFTFDKSVEGDEVVALTATYYDRNTEGTDRVITLYDEPVEVGDKLYLDVDAYKMIYGYNSPISRFGVLRKTKNGTYYTVITAPISRNIKRKTKEIQKAGMYIEGTAKNQGVEYDDETYYR